MGGVGAGALTPRAPAPYTFKVIERMRRPRQLQDSLFSFLICRARAAGLGLAILGLLASAAPSARADASGFPFLRLPVSTRSAGMGETGVSFLAGASAFYANPAGIAAADGNASSKAKWGAGGEASLVHHEALGSLRQDAVVVALDKRAAGLALSFNTFYSEAIDETDPVGTVTGVFGLVSYDAELAYARRLAGGWRLGVSGGYVRERIAGSSAATWTVGAGALWQVPSLPGLALGAAVAELGGSAAFSNIDGAPGESVSLPATYRAGASYGRPLGARGAWLLAADVRKARDEDLTEHAGVEIKWSAISLRAGTRLGTDVGHFTAGAGIESGRFRFDYAFLPTGEVLGASHRAELGVRFGM
jgi:hypothetical protein